MHVVGAPPSLHAAMLCRSVIDPPGVGSRLVHSRGILSASHASSHSRAPRWDGLIGNKAFARCSHALLPPDPHGRTPSDFSRLRSQEIPPALAAPFAIAPRPFPIQLLHYACDFLPATAVDSNKLAQHVVFGARPCRACARLHLCVVLTAQRVRVRADFLQDVIVCWRCVMCSLPSLPDGARVWVRRRIEDLAARAWRARVRVARARLHRQHAAMHLRVSLNAGLRLCECLQGSVRARVCVYVNCQRSVSHVRVRILRCSPHPFHIPPSLPYAIGAFSRDFARSGHVCRPPWR